jgi:hypothetical protein
MENKISENMPRKLPNKLSLANFMCEFCLKNDFHFRTQIHDIILFLFN